MIDLFEVRNLEDHPTSIITTEILNHLGQPIKIWLTWLKDDRGIVIDDDGQFLLEVHKLFNLNQEKLSEKIIMLKVDDKDIKLADNGYLYIRTTQKDLEKMKGKFLSHLCNLYSHLKSKGWSANDT